MTRPAVPNSLRTWFVIHFAVDVMVAVPLFLFPRAFLSLLDWPVIDPFAARIIAAALFGIGIESFLGRNADQETFKNMLNLKLIWSGAVILGAGLSIFQSPAPAVPAQWLVLVIFILFHLLWARFRFALRHKS